MPQRGPNGGDSGSNVFIELWMIIFSSLMNLGYESIQRIRRIIIKIFRDFKKKSNVGLPPIKLVNPDEPLRECLAGKQGQDLVRTLEIFGSGSRNLPEGFSEGAVKYLKECESQRGLTFEERVLQMGELLLSELIDLWAVMVHVFEAEAKGALDLIDPKMTGFAFKILVHKLINPRLSAAEIARDLGLAINLFLYHLGTLKAIFGTDKTPRVLGELLFRGGIIIFEEKTIKPEDFILINLRLLGFTDKEIGRLIYKCAGTVSNRMHEIRDSFNAGSFLELVIILRQKAVNPRPLVETLLLLKPLVLRGLTERIEKKMASEKKAVEMGETLLRTSKPYEIKECVLNKGNAHPDLFPKPERKKRGRPPKETPKGSPLGQNSDKDCPNRCPILRAFLENLFLMICGMGSKYSQEEKDILIRFKDEWQKRLLELEELTPSVWSSCRQNKENCLGLLEKLEREKFREADPDSLLEADLQARLAELRPFLPDRALDVVQKLAAQASLEEQDVSMKFMPDLLKLLDDVQ